MDGEKGIARSEEGEEKKNTDGLFFFYDKRRFISHSQSYKSKQLRVQECAALI